MPLYDYQCPACGERFEELRPLAERQHADCPKCGKQADKQLSSFFTGSKSSGASSSGGSVPPCGGGGMPGG